MSTTNGTGPSDSDALKRARSQAEKYKPKQPSGLRSSSRLSTSTITSEDGSEVTITAPAGTTLGEGLLAQSITPAVKPKFSIHISTIGETSPSKTYATASKGSAPAPTLTNGTTPSISATTINAEVKKCLDKVPASVFEEMAGKFDFLDVPPTNLDPEVRKSLEVVIAHPGFEEYAWSLYGHKLAV